MKSKPKRKYVGNQGVKTESENSYSDSDEDFKLGDYKALYDPKLEANWVELSISTQILLP